MKTVFIDGQEGTTGLKIGSRLAERGDLRLLAIDPALRKDREARKALINAADVVFLCLPDDAARESVSLVENPNVRVIDASTAHRTSPDWTYGFPELSPEHRRAVAASRRICVPGCHATGFIAIVYPLIQLGILSKEVLLHCHSITGYSGGGKKMIAAYEAEDRLEAYDSPRQYGLTLQHKHLPEMKHATGLAHAPVFNPIVCDFFAGMAVSVPLHKAQMETPATCAQLLERLQAFYAGQRFVRVAAAPEDGFLPANLHTGSNTLTVFVCGNDEQVTLISVLDNLGKGASGAAVQCMNIALGLPEDTGL